MEVFAEPQKLPLTIPGWEQQKRRQPWQPVSPSYVAEAGKYKGKPLKWIISNDAVYVKWVLTHYEKLQEPAMVMMSRYFQEHYQPSDPYHVVKRHRTC